MTYNIRRSSNPVLWLVRNREINGALFKTIKKTTNEFPPVLDFREGRQRVVNLKLLTKLTSNSLIIQISQLIDKSGRQIQTYKSDIVVFYHQKNMYAMVFSTHNDDLEGGRNA